MSIFFANHCGCWCIPILLPHSLRHPLHVSVVIRNDCYLSHIVVVNAHTTLRAVVHGQRCCFTCSKDLFPISTRSSLASHSTRAGAPCSSCAVAATCPKIRAGAEPEASEGLEFVFFCCGASRPPTRLRHHCLVDCTI